MSDSIESGWMRENLSELPHPPLPTLTGRSHDLKCWPGPFHAIRDGRKRFEYRKNDRAFAVGDILKLRLWDPGARAIGGLGLGAYVGQEGRPVFHRDDAHSLLCRVTYILTDSAQLGVPAGFCVMSIKVCDEK